MNWTDDNRDEGCYCEECDQSYPCEQFAEVPVGQFVIHWHCPKGHAQDTFGLSQYYWRLGLYVLSVADNDWSLPIYNHLPDFET